MKLKKTAAILIAVAFIVAPAVYAKAKPAAIGKAAKSAVSVSLEQRAMAGIRSATKYFMQAQKPDGSWNDDPAITALVAYSLMLDPVYTPDKKVSTAVQKGLDYVAKFAQPDGGIYRKEFSNYVTAVCLMALSKSNQKQYQPIIAKAKNFLIETQSDEGEGFTKDKVFYGGYGYGGTNSDGRPDMSNTWLALSAIKSAEQYQDRFSGVIPKNKGQVEKEEKELGLHWQKALVFLNRCQNNKDVNDQSYTSDNGGFMYETGTYNKERSHSYGSMTYAGVMSLLIADVDKADPRVKKAVEWIKANYTLDTNPGFGTASLFYYYTTFAKSMDLINEDVLTDAMGKQHRWREDLVYKLVSLQKGEGYWQNPNNRYMENMKELATAYSVIAMKHALKHQSF